MNAPVLWAPGRGSGTGRAAWIRSHHVWADPYVVLSYPTAAQLTKYGAAGPYKGTSRTTRLRNVGWAEGQYNLARMRAAGLTAPVIWMDVEVYPFRPWSSSRSGNKAVKYGLAEWHTTGPASLTTASKACTAASFNGGLHEGALPQVLSWQLGPGVTRSRGR